MYKLLVLLLISLFSTGCTIVNLAQPEPDDSFLQRKLEQHFGPDRTESQPPLTDSSY